MTTRNKSKIVFTRAMTLDDLINNSEEACTISAKTLKEYIDSLLQNRSAKNPPQSGTMSGDQMIIGNNEPMWG